MAVDLEKNTYDYDCYAYFLLEKDSYIIKDAEENIELLYSLKTGDKVFIKGLGNLEIINLDIDEYEWKKGKYIYQEISIKCKII